MEGQRSCVPERATLNKHGGPGIPVAVCHHGQQVQAEAPQLWHGSGHALKAGIRHKGVALEAEVLDGGEAGVRH
eukprot:1159343-Pelagomonas_calceolata.AAC.8